MKKINIPQKDNLKLLLQEVEKKLAKRPSREALDKLSIFVGYQNWQSFLDSFEEEKQNNG